MLRFLCNLADEKEEALCRLTDTFAEKGVMRQKEKMAILWNSINFGEPGIVEI